MPALDDHEDTFAALFENTPLGVTITHFPTDDPAEGYLVAANAAANRILGFDLASYLGQSTGRDGVDDGFDDDEVDANQQRLFDAVTTGKSQEMTMTQVTRGPVTGHFRSAIIPLPDRRVATLFRRIDSEIEAERALEWAIRSLETSNADLTRFSAMVAHDLKNPLAGISGYAQLLQSQRDSLPEAARKPTDRIVELATLAADMIDGLLTTSTQPTSPDNVGWVSLESVRAWVIDLLAEQLERVDGRVEATSLPDAYGNEAAIRQVALNLVSNSIRYRHPDRPLVISLRPRQETLESGAVRHTLDVVDNGLGIPDAEKETVFDWGRRGRRNAGDTGSGLGLAACRAAMRNMGAEIFVGDDPPGGGTTMCLVMLRRP